MLSAVSDDYFGTSSAPPGALSGYPPPQSGVAGAYQSPMMTPPGWAPPASAAQPAAAAVTVSQAGLAAIGAAVAGLLTCLGAWGPWVRITGPEGFSVGFGGMHGGLDGKWALAAGALALVLGVALYTMPSGHPLRTGTAGAVVVVGLIGLIVVVHQYVVISDHVSEINGALASLLGVHASSGWGLWLAGFGCTCAGAAGVLSLVL